MTFGFITDVHYANKDTVATRYYRDGLPKLQDAVAAWNADGVDFAVMCGDFTDHGGNNATMALADLATMDAAYAVFSGDRYYVFGNHENDQLTKAQFLANTAMPAAHYSFDKNGVHFVVLDGNYRSNNDADPYSAGNYSWNVNYVPPNQRAWLTADLSSTNLPVVVFCHYRLDTTGDYALANASAVRTILEASGKVISVFTGHNHINVFSKINGIPYCGMMAATEGVYPKNAYAIVSVYPECVGIKGYGDQQSYTVQRSA